MPFVKHNAVTTYKNTSSILQVALVRDGRPLFAEDLDEPWNLIFTAKADREDADVDALVQKTDVAGIAVSGSLAFVEIVPDDTAELAETLLYCGIKAQRVSDGWVEMVADFKWTLKRENPNGLETVIPVYTSQPPVLAPFEPHTHAGDALVPDSVSASSLAVGRNSLNASPQTGVLLFFNSGSVQPVAVSCEAVTVARNLILPDKDGTFAMLSDIVTPIIRTAAQGPPKDTGWVEEWHIDMVDVVVDVTGTAVFEVELEVNDTYDVPLLSGDDPAEIAAKISAVLMADATFAGILESYVSGTMLIIRYLSEAGGGLGGAFSMTGPAGMFDGESYVWFNDGYPTIAAQASPVGALAAEAIGQECITGDTGLNKLIHKAVEIEPTVWNLIGPAGVVEDPNNPGEFLKLTVDGDGAPAHEPYTLS